MMWNNEGWQRRNAERMRQLYGEPEPREEVTPEVTISIDEIEAQVQAFAQALEHAEPLDITQGV